MAAEDAGLALLVRPTNAGKGAAVAFAIERAAAEGFTHALVMDADGQHPADRIECFMATSRAAPDAAVLGLPQFAADAPLLRIRGRRISNALMRVETLWTGTGDCLFGFRVYPIRPLLRAFGQTRWMRRFDFDPEAAVRLCWLGVPIINLPAPVRYLTAEDGGVSHFRYGRDNALLTWMHTRLLLGTVGRAPMLLWRLARSDRFRHGTCML